MGGGRQAAADKIPVTDPQTLPQITLQATVSAFASGTSEVEGLVVDGDDAGAPEPVTMAPSGAVPAARRLVQAAGRKRRGAARSMAPAASGHTASEPTAELGEDSASYPTAGV